MTMSSKKDAIVLPNLSKEEFVAQTLGVELYFQVGIHGVERLVPYWPIVILLRAKIVIHNWNCSGWAFPTARTPIITWMWLLQRSEMSMSAGMKLNTVTGLPLRIRL